MVNCPLCEGMIDVEEEDLDEGDEISCDECAATLTVASLNPLELESADEADEDEEDEDFEEADEDDEEEAEEEEETDDWK